MPTSTAREMVAATPTPEPVTGTDDWSMFAHDMTRRGLQTQWTGISQSTVAGLQLRWSYTTPSGGGYQAGPIAVDGTIYAADNHGVVVALDAVKGTVKWTYSLGSGAAATPFLDGNLLFVGTDWQYGKIVALDAANGAVVWSQELNGGLRGGPLALNGTLYVPVSIGDPPYCMAGGVYAFDEQTGAPGGASWLTVASPPNGGGGGGVWSPLSYDGTRIVFGSGNTCTVSPTTSNAIVAMSPAFVTQWDIPTADPLSDDDVGAGTLIDTNDVGYTVGKNGTAYAVNVATGTLAWTHVLPASDGFGGIDTPGETDGTLFVATGALTDPTASSTPGGELFGLSPQTGATKWSIITQTEIKSSVVSLSDLAFAELDNTINALDPTNGKVLWSYQSAGDFDASSPAIVPSGLYAADMSGTIYAFGLPSNSATATRRRTIAERVWSSPNAIVPPKFRTKGPPAYCTDETRSTLKRSDAHALAVRSQ
ncbi:MAG: PQQ-binding-like beta-propeller repeat protein [Vulcanimicrobiaceae bacterium]